MMDGVHDRDFGDEATYFAGHAAVAPNYAPPAYLLDHYWWAYVDPRVSPSLRSNYAFRENVLRLQAGERAGASVFVTPRWDMETLPEVVA
mgnify:CR=1 FL=1